MKENINFENSTGVTGPHEAELLRHDTKSLIYSLQKHQHAVKLSFSKLRDENNQYESDEPNYPKTSKQIMGVQKVATFLIDCNEHLGKLNANDQIVDDAVDDDQEDDDFLLTESLYLKKNPSSMKTVSFSENLGTKTLNAARSRSTSPNLNKTPTKSILKKQLVQDELSDDDESDVSSNSTNSLLCSDIYGEFEKDLNFGDVNESFSGKYEADNPTKLIDMITKRRQSYLSHYYNESGQASEKLKHTTAKNEDNCENCDHNFTGRYKPTEQELKAASNGRLIKCHNKKGIGQRNNVSGSNSGVSLRSHLKQNGSIRSNESNTFKAKIKLKTASSLCRKNSDRDYKRLAAQMKKNKPLLGYDWALDAIDTNLNTTKTKFTKPEEYWQELSQFRTQNKEDCVSTKQANFDGSTTTFFDMDSTTVDVQNQDKNNDNDDGRSHKCKRFNSQLVLPN